MSEKDFKIGDFVEFFVDPEEIQGAGRLMGIANEFPYVRTWIVEILRRDTKFWKDTPELAVVIAESQMKRIEKI
jgi:hypothetical protein